MRLAACALLVGVIRITPGSAGCTQHSYCVRRSALVPTPAPDLRPATEPLGHVEASAGTETLAYAWKPERLEGRNVGLYVPRHQLSGQLLFSPHRIFQIGFTFETGFSENAMPVARGLIAPPSGAIGGAGLHFGLIFPVHDRVNIAWSCDLWGYAVRSRIAYREGGCDGDPRTWENFQKGSALFVGRTQLAVGIDLRWSHLSIGVGLRNQPHNVDRSVETEYTASDIDPRIEQAIYPYAFVTWELHLSPRWNLGLAVYQPLNVDPIIYSPLAHRGSDPPGHRPRPGAHHLAGPAAHPTAEHPLLASARVEGFRPGGTLGYGAGSSRGFCQRRRRSGASSAAHRAGTAT